MNVSATGLVNVQSTKQDTYLRRSHSTRTNLQSLAFWLLRLGVLNVGCLLGEFGREGAVDHHVVDLSMLLFVEAGHRTAPGVVVDVFSAVRVRLRPTLNLGEGRVGGTASARGV